MNEMQKMLADIVAEMHKRKEQLEDAIFYAPLCYSTECTRAQMEILDEFIDRIDAALKREKTKLMSQPHSGKSAHCVQRRVGMTATETIADIAAEKRERAQAIRKSLSVVPDRRDSQIAEAEELESDANRIEAAYKRESITPKPDPDWKAICAKCNDGEIEPDCEYYGEPNGCNSPIYGEHPTEKSSVVGNTAAMRDALEELMKFTCNSCERRLCEEDAEEEDGQRVPSLCSAIIRARNALAKPPRNCDRFGGETESMVAFLNEKWLVGVADLKEYPFCEWSHVMKAMYAKWLLAPSTERKGGRR